MSTCKLKVNVNLSLLFYFVASAAQNGEFEGLVDCYPPQHIIRVLNSQRKTLKSLKFAIMSGRDGHCDSF